MLIFKLEKIEKVKKILIYSTANELLTTILREIQTKR